VHDLLDTLKQCVERVDRYRRLGQRVGESNTKAGLIEPVIAALGWDVLDPDEVHREYRRRSPDNPVDYALLLSRTPRLFIEAKGLGGNIDDPKWANQTISYAAVAGVEWVALTDGAEWRLYNAHAPVPVEQKLFRAVRLTEDIVAAFELLALLSKDNLRDNRIQELWRGFFVDRQVNAALPSCSTPASQLATWSPWSPSASPTCRGVISGQACSAPGRPSTSRPQAFPPHPCRQHPLHRPRHRRLRQDQQVRLSSQRLAGRPSAAPSGTSRCRTSWPVGDSRRGLGWKPTTGANTTPPNCLPTATSDSQGKRTGPCPARAGPSNGLSSALISPSRSTAPTGGCSGGRPTPEPVTPPP
jgi:hypothetical protein